MAHAWNIIKLVALLSFALGVGIRYQHTEETNKCHLHPGWSVVDNICQAPPTFVATGAFVKVE